MDGQQQGERVDSASRIILAAPKILFRTFMDPEIFLAWRVPDGAEGRLARFEPRIGGEYQLALSAPDCEANGVAPQGLTAIAGRFIDMLPDTRVVEKVRYVAEGLEPAIPITLTTLIEPGNGGTKVTLQATGVPPSMDGGTHRDMLAGALRRLSLLTD
ncbi:SRPBCC domain-containing protein [Sphingopyxis alaskensis]|uniref:SRPBCC domain-containing protein n=1 Tax=Sphingopyxis alaskensis TaxID=117207 RepID=UPI0019CC2244|nr:SRPBCC domain-containing protein [Sphingopyxis alaskensis]MBD3744822.1 SRPBCC domain-containing protein [Sphingopyxis terrae]MCM3418772.1 SRPBCC domain-containing protein [Sphingopyxis alaskensis]